MLDHVSEWEVARDKLKAARCPICMGSGTCDSNDGYGIDIDEWICKKCKGTGTRFNILKEEKDD